MSFPTTSLLLLTTYRLPLRLLGAARTVVKRKKKARRIRRMLARWGHVNIMVIECVGARE